MMALRTPQTEEILLPVRPGYIPATLIVALLVNLLPWSGAVAMAKPDFIALTLLYWYTYEPRRIGFTSAWILGLVMDVADASLFGQHALAYSLLAFVAIVLHRRVQRFALGAQVLHTIAMLALPLVVMLVVRVASGAEFPGFLYFAACLTGAAFWPLIAWLLPLPQRPRTDPDHPSL